MLAQNRLPIHRHSSGVRKKLKHTASRVERKLILYVAWISVFVFVLWHTKMLKYDAVQLNYPVNLHGVFPLRDIPKFLILIFHGNGMEIFYPILTLMRIIVKVKRWCGGGKGTRNLDFEGAKPTSGRMSYCGVKVSGIPRRPC